MISMDYPKFCSWVRFRHLHLLDTLGRTRNMHTAAELMNLSQPALSKMLKEIENMLGFSIFYRLPRTLEPTHLGVEVLRYAQVALNDANSFVMRINDLRDGGHGQLRFGGIFGAMTSVLPEAIVEIKCRWPLLTLEVFEQTSDQLMIMLEEKKIDLAIARFTNERQMGEFDFVTLEAEPFCVVVSSLHPLAGCDEVSLLELGRWPWILFPLGSPTRERVEMAFASAGFQAPRNTIDTFSTQTFLQVLQAGPMIAILPESMVKAHIENGSLVALETPIKLVPQDFGILTRKGEELSGVAREFSNLLLRNVRSGAAMVD